MKLKKFIIFVLFLITLVGTVTATGTCTLGKDTYYNGETAVVSCQCTSTAEQDREGYFLWQLDNGTILRNVTSNSNACTETLFVDSYTFNFNNVSGNVTWVTDAISWNNVDDTTSDNFSVGIGSTLNCQIEDIATNSTIAIGTNNAYKIKVTDQITGNPLVGAKCVGHIEGIDGEILFTEPYEVGEYRRTNSQGHVMFMHDFQEQKWDLNSSYIGEFHCYCEDSNNDEVCYNEGTGNRTDFKSCETRVIFGTDGTDLRQRNTPGFLPGIIILIPMLLAAVMIAGVFFVGKEHWALQIGLYLLSYVSMFASVMFSLLMLDRYFEFEALQDGLTWYVWLFGLVFTGILIYFITLVMWKIKDTTMETLK